MPRRARVDRRSLAVPAGSRALLHGGYHQYCSRGILFGLFGAGIWVFGGGVYQCSSSCAQVGATAGRSAGTLRHSFSGSADRTLSCGSGYSKARCRRGQGRKDNCSTTYSTITKLLEGLPSRGRSPSAFRGQTSLQEGRSHQERSASIRVLRVIRVCCSHLRPQ